MERHNDTSVQTERDRTARYLWYSPRSIILKSKLKVKRDRRQNDGNKRMAFVGELVLLVTALSFLPSEAFAHHAEVMKNHPFLQGLSMPIHGVDHLLVTLGVGLIAVQLGRWAMWMVPSAFSLLILVGGLLNVNGVAVPFLEHAILASVLILGAILALRQPLPLLFSLLIVGVSAVIQGSALIKETTTDWSFFLFSAGCLISAFVVLATGMGLGFAIQKYFENKHVLRYAGVAIIAAGIIVYLFPAANDIIIHLLEKGKR